MSYKYAAALRSERNKNRLYEIVVKAVENYCSENDVSRRDIADKIGRNPVQISRWLSGPSNWTLDTLSDLLFAVDAELDYEVIYDKQRVKANVFHSAGESRKITVPTVGTSHSASQLYKVSVSYANA